MFSDAAIPMQDVVGVEKMTYVHADDATVLAAGGDETAAAAGDANLAPGHATVAAASNANLAPGHETLECDALVVGAGPAGSLAAAQLARRGLHTVLVDKSEFPRPKVCGCCLNYLSLNTLEVCGLPNLAESLGAFPLHALRLSVRRTHANIFIPAACALSRTAFDTALVQHARDSGVRVLQNIHATIGSSTTCGETRSVLLQTSEGVTKATVKARVVVAADGLRGHSLDNLPEFACQVQEQSRVGIGAITSDADKSYVAGTIYMACHKNGYVGLVRLEDGSLDIAAAVDLHALRQARTPASCVAHILIESGLKLPCNLAELHWRGTGPLSQVRKRVAGRRVLVIGDAAGYSEPFTGEGIGWALLAARLIAPIADGIAGAANDGDMSSIAEQWQYQHKKLIGRRHQSSARLSMLLRHERLTLTAAQILKAAPSMTSWLCQKLLISEELLAT